jgi:hypothetical protein
MSEFGYVYVEKTKTDVISKGRMGLTGFGTKDRG